MRSTSYFRQPKFKVTSGGSPLFFFGEEDSEVGVDLILGAPGNPTQIIMSGLLFSGNPTGTISVGSVRGIIRNRTVRLAVPIILGDYYKGFRMIGTNHNYLDIHKMGFREGRLWDSEMEVVIGHSVARKLNIDVGERLSIEIKQSDGIDHGDIMIYEVVGILEKSGIALDKVMLTSIESFWAGDDLVKSQHIIESDSLLLEKEMPYDMFPFDFPVKSEKLLSYVLIQYRSPMAALAYPKYVKRESGLQAVTPGIEMLRLNATINRVLDYFMVIVYILTGIAGFSVVLYFRDILVENETDFAVFRAIGCSRHKIAYMVLLLALFIADTGAFIGIIFGHISAQIIAGTLPFARMAGITGWSFYGTEILIYFLVHVLTLLLAFHSAIKAYKMDVKSVLTSS